MATNAARKAGRAAPPSNEIAVDGTPPPPAYEPVQFRGRYYMRGPLPATGWAQVVGVLQRLKDAEARGEFHDALADAAKVIRRHLPPAARWERWVARVRPNPFRRASVAEIGVLLGLILRGASVTSRFGATRTPEVPRG